MRRFSSWEAVEVLLRSEACPPEAMQPAGVGEDDDGVWIGAPDEGRPVSCWAEALPLKPSSNEADRVLFQLPAADLLPLAAELLRLGCDRQSWLTLGDEAWLVAWSPPWYSVLSALDGGPRSVFVPAGPDVWAPYGKAHALDLQASGELLVLATPWIRLPREGWVDVYDRMEIHAPSARVLEVPVEPPKLPVALRLVDSGRSVAPSFWVLRERGREAVETLLAHVPDDLVDRLSFAVSGEIVLLKARPFVGGPPVLELPAEAYTPLLELPNLYRPVDATLEPPLRRDRIREVLATEPFEIGWLVPEEGGVAVERMLESAFRPLSDWVDYVLARDEATLQGWTAAATFAFEDWIDAGAEWDDAPKRPAKAKAKRSADAPAPVEAKRSKAEPVARVQIRKLAPRKVVIVKDAERDARLAELAELERRFVALETGPDDPERRELWTGMAALHRQLGQHRDATLCWVHAVWEAEDDALLTAWAEEELGAVGQTVDTLRDAVLADPSPALLRATAAALAAGALAGDAELSPLFHARSEGLDVRSAWLARRRIADGDDLALARAQDDLLAGMREGLVLERDVPTFVRTLDGEAARDVTDHLQAMLEHFRATKRKRNLLEAPPELTFAYVDLAFAWGFASVGARERAAELRDAGQTLDRSDAVHDALVTAYEARIDQALSGAPRETPLPAEASAKFGALSDFERYQVDRLRNASGILETQERLNPFTAFERRLEDARGPEFARLRGVDDPGVLLPALTQLVEQAAGHEQQARLLDGVLDFLPLLPALDALPLLDAVLVQIDALGPEDRVRLATDALSVAGLLGRTDRARKLVQRVLDAIGELPPDALGTVADLLIASLRSLRRVGLDDELASLLHAVTRALRVDPTEEDSPLRDDLPSRVTRTAVVAGLLALDAPDALEQLDDLLGGLDQALRVPQRLQLTRALASALALAPRQAAFERLPQLSAHLVGITDCFGTNSHYCLSVVSYAESTVLGYADTELGSRARAWVDASEFRVRRRILGS